MKKLRGKRTLATLFTICSDLIRRRSFSAAAFAIDLETFLIFLSADTRFFSAHGLEEHFCIGVKLAALLAALFWLDCFVWRYLLAMMSALRSSFNTESVTYTLVCMCLLRLLVMLLLLLLLMILLWVCSALSKTGEHMF